MLLQFCKLIVVSTAILSLLCMSIQCSSPNHLLLKNKSDTEILGLLNLDYPDSSLHNAMVNLYLKPNDENYIGGEFDLKGEPGLTIMLFDHDYFRRQRTGANGRPDTYLSEDSMLARYVLSKQQLDSLGWIIAYP